MADPTDITAVPTASPSPDAPSKGVPLVELGVTGLKRAGGYVIEEFLPELSGIRGVRVYTEMRDNDPIVGAMLFAVEMLCRGVAWEGTPEDAENEDDVAAAEFLEECRLDMAPNWAEFLTEVLTMLPFGWSLFEEVYKVRRGPDDPDAPSRYTDRLLGWKKLGFRPQDSLYMWRFTDVGEPAAFVQYNQFPTPGRPTMIDISLGRCTLFRTRSFKNNPEGRSVLRNAYRPWYFKRQMEVIEGIGVERDLAGVPVVWVPSNILKPGASAEDVLALNSYKQLVRNLRRDEQEGVVMPLVYDQSGNKLYDITLLTTGGRRQFDTAAIRRSYASDMASSMLADFILLGHEGVGSLALSKDKTELFAAALTGWLDIIQTQFSEACDRLLQANRMKGRAYIGHGGVETTGLTEIADYIQKLANAGVIMPDDKLEESVRDRGGLPQRVVPASEERAEAADQAQQNQLELKTGAPGNEEDDQTPKAPPTSAKKPAKGKKK